MAVIKCRNCGKVFRSMIDGGIHEALCIKYSFKPRWRSSRRKYICKAIKTKNMLKKPKGL